MATSTDTSSPLLNLRSFPAPSLLSPAAEPTLNHLRALPSLLRPISPQLSALHAARVRLLVDLPLEVKHDWCCGQCGHLRAGFGWRVVRGHKGKKRAAPVLVEGDERKGCSKNKGKKRKVAAGKKGTTISSATSTPGLTERETDPDSTQAPLIAIPPPPPPRNKLKTKCSLCGISYAFKGSDPLTVSSFPSARQSARRSSRISSCGTSTADDLKPATAPTPSSPLSTKPQPPSLLKGSPKLAHIPLSHPTPVTEVAPPPAHPSLSPSASPVSGGSASGSVEGVKKPKKKKKSGLQKLLAESAARKDDASQASMGGLLKWGLG